MVQQAEPLDRGVAFLGRFLKDDLPATRRAGGDVLRAVVQVENVSSAVPGLPLDDFIEPGVRFHRAVLIGENVPVEVAVSSILEERSLRAAMVGVDTVYHLASAEWHGLRGSLMDIDIQGTQTVTRAAIEAGVQRFFYVSHLGADRASAYPLLKAKAIAEEHIRRSGLDYTIIRTGILLNRPGGQHLQYQR